MTEYIVALHPDQKPDSVNSFLAPYGIQLEEHLPSHRNDLNLFLLVTSQVDLVELIKGREEVLSIEERRKIELGKKSS